MSKYDDTQLARRISFRPRFGMKCLLLLVLATAIALAYLKGALDRASVQERAVRILHSHNCVVGYDDGRLYEEIVDGEGTGWKEALFGHDFFHDVHSVECSDDGATNDVMTAIGHLRSLYSLQVSSTAITDTGLANIGRLQRLETLDLSGTRITGEGLRHLTHVSGLKSLDLTGCTSMTLRGYDAILHLRELEQLYVEATDEALAILGTHGSIERLSLNYSELGGFGLQHLRGMPSLRSLSLDDVRFLNGLSCAQDGLHRVEYLSLVRSNVSDADMAYLGSLPNLRSLNLCNSQVTDRGLMALCGATRLKELQILTLTRVTKAGVARFGKARPDVKVN